MKRLRFEAVVDGNDGDPNHPEADCRCAEFDGFEAPADDPLWDARTPPLHDGCRCVLVEVST